MGQRQALAAELGEDNRMRIAIDAMGGDHAPQAVLEGVKLVLPELKQDVQLVLYGDETVIKSGLSALGVTDARVSIVATSEAASTTPNGDRSAPLARLGSRAVGPCRTPGR